jgi:hypothetical protein
MATNNKNFKVKHGLIVEGSIATVNGNQVLTETESDQYIIDLIGGETLVTSVESTQLEVINGELNVKANVFDAYGSASTAETNANDYTNTQLEDYTPTSSLDTTIDGYGYLKSDDISGKQDTLTAGSNIDITGTTISVTGLDSEDISDFNTAALSATASAYDISGAASTAQQNAEDYTDTALESYTPTASLDTTIDGYGYLKSADLSGYATESYVNTAVDNLVDGAPGLLDTLNEIAAAINDDENYATTMTTALSNKQDNLTASTGITIDGSNNISVTANTYDAYGAASQALSDAEDYADGLASNYEVSGSVSTHSDLTTGVHGVTGDVVGTSDTQTLTGKTIDASNNTISNIANSSLTHSAVTVNNQEVSLGSSITLDTDDIAEGSTNEYFTDARAASAAAALLTSAIQTNISITGTGAGLTITAEDGIEGKTTDDLDEGEDNLYFLDSRVIDAVDNADITPNSVQIDTYRKEEATRTDFANATTATVHSFAYPFGSVKYLVRAVGSVEGTLHSQITEIIATVDGNNNVHLTEYGSVHTTEPALATFTVDYDGVSSFRLRATSTGQMEIVVAATLLSWAD